MHADQDAWHPWLRDETVWLQDVLARRVPVLGICLGVQLLARAAGSWVGPLEEPEIGWYGAELTDAGAADPVLGALPRSFEAFQWHYYTYGTPAGAVELARSPACTQAFRLGDTCWGVQFHPEVTRTQLDGWLARHRRPAAGPGAPPRRDSLADRRLERSRPDAVRRVPLRRRARARPRRVAGAARRARPRARCGGAARRLERAVARFGRRRGADRGGGCVRRAAVRTGRGGDMVGAALGDPVHRSVVGTRDRLLRAAHRRVPAARPLRRLSRRTRFRSGARSDRQRGRARHARVGRRGCSASASSPPASCSCAASATARPGSRSR